MNIGVILAGGTGTRMNDNCPKQYMKIKNRPIISYTMSKFGESYAVDCVVIVADESWYSFIEKWIPEDLNGKPYYFARPGKTRQHSIYNAINVAAQFAEYNDILIIHDAARPMVDTETITKCVDEARSFGGAMPVIPVKDTVYMSKDGEQIDGLLNRKELYAGQAPEAFVFGRFLEIHEEAADEEIANCRGTSEIAYKHGMLVKIFEGRVENFKITDKNDFERFKQIVEGGQFK